VYSERIRRVCNIQNRCSLQALAGLPTFEIIPDACRFNKYVCTRRRSDGVRGGSVPAAAAAAAATATQRVRSSTSGLRTTDGRVIGIRSLRSAQPTGHRCARQLQLLRRNTTYFDLFWISNNLQIYKASRLNS